jgi:hypothetical protein
MNTTYTPFNPDLFVFKICCGNHFQGERNEAPRGELRVFGAEFRRSLGEGEWEKQPRLNLACVRDILFLEGARRPVENG